jgi:hypothetical protein
MTFVHAFMPAGNAKTVQLAASSTVGNVQFDGALSSTVTSTNPSPISAHVRVVNAGTSPAYIEFGSSSYTASSSTAMPILAGTVEVFSPGGGKWLSGVCTAGLTTTLYATPGTGI